MGLAVLLEPFRLVARVTFVGPQGDEVSSGTLEAALVSGAVLGCLRATTSPRVRVDFCAGLEAGPMLGRVEASGERELQVAFFLAAEGGVIFNLRFLGDDMDLLIGLDLVVPIVRDPFFLSHATTPVIASEVVGGRASFGLAWRL